MPPSAKQMRPKSMRVTCFSARLRQHTDEHRQPSYNLRSRHSLECRKHGSLKRKLCTHAPSEPIGMRPWLRSDSTIGSNFTAAASPTPTAAVARRRRPTQPRTPATIAVVAIKEHDHVRGICCGQPSIGTLAHVRGTVPERRWLPFLRRSRVSRHSSCCRQRRPGREIR